MIFSYKSNTTSTSGNFPKTNCLSPGRSKVNQGGGQQILLSSFIPLICIRGTKMNGGKCLRIDSRQFESRVVRYDEMTFRSLLNKVPPVRRVPFKCPGASIA